MKAAKGNHKSQLAKLKAEISELRERERGLMSHNKWLRHALARALDRLDKSKRKP